MLHLDLYLLSNIYCKTIIIFAVGFLTVFISVDCNLHLLQCGGVRVVYVVHKTPASDRGHPSRVVLGDIPGQTGRGHCRGEVDRLGQGHEGEVVLVRARVEVELRVGEDGGHTGPGYKGVPHPVAPQQHSDVLSSLWSSARHTGG